MVRVTSKASNRLRDEHPTSGERPLDAGEMDSPAQPATFPVAKVQPLDVTGVRTVAVGAGLWLGALAALLPFYSSLQEQGRGWWLWTCGAGFGLGLIGLEYCRRRRRRLAAHPEREVETSPLGAAGF